MKTINEVIYNFALSFVGIQEKKGNMGFSDPSFYELMETVGWKETHAWCSYFAELVWKLAYAKFDSTYIERFDHLFSASAVSTWTNFNNCFDFKCSNFPEPGSVVIWQNYKDYKKLWSGHAGIVIDVKGNKINTVEGNTNYAGSREGDMVAKKIRTISYKPKEKGLVLLGFIHPKEV